MKNGYCEVCEKRIRAVNRPFSWVIFLLTFIVGGFIWYPLYHIVFKRKVFCQVCLTRLK